MRKALNENPVVQIAVIAVLAIGVAILLLTRLSGGSSSAPATTTPGASAPSAAADAAESIPAAASTIPASPAPAPTAAGDVPAPVAPAADSDFKAGPGLPAPVVNAYNDGKAVVLLIFRRGGIDDKAVQVEANLLLRAHPDVALFVLDAGDISRYSRITEGVNVNQVPALVVMKPKDKADGGQPLATVSYGFRGPASVVQAVDDALYAGRQLPYYPTLSPQQKHPRG